jgi:hypothetical protein
MKGRQYTDQQFSHILDVLILYKRTCPDKEVYLNEASIKAAFDHFMKSGMFEGAKANVEDHLSDILSSEKPNV